MAVGEGELRCERTGMPLSRRLRDCLGAVFVDRTRAARRHPEVATKLRAPFFCPRCGIRLTVDGCPSCGEVLDEFARDVIELHPHRR